MQSLYEVRRHHDGLAIANKSTPSLSIPRNLFIGDEGVLRSELPGVDVKINKVLPRSLSANVVLKRSVKVKSLRFFVDRNGVSPGVREGVKCRLGAFIEVDRGERAVDV